MAMNTAYLLLGSNLGNRESFLAKAIELLSGYAGKVAETSSIYRTAPWPPRGGSDKGDFLNQVICIETSDSAHVLLKKALSIEEDLGRKRIHKWESRTIDIDILFFNSDIVQTPELIIPHPFLHERKFTLMPLAEIAENLIHPVFNKSIKELLLNNSDTLRVEQVIKAS